MTISPLQAVSTVSLIPVAGAQSGSSVGGGLFDGFKTMIANTKAQIAGGAGATGAAPTGTPLTQQTGGAATAAASTSPLGGAKKADGSVGLMDGVLLKAGMGAMAGAGMSFFLPFGPLLGGAIGAIAGAGIGLFFNWRKIKNIQSQNVAQVSAMGVQPQDAAQQQALMTGQVAPLGIVPEGSAAQVKAQLEAQQAQQGGTATQQGGTATQQGGTSAGPVPTQGSGTSTGQTAQTTNTDTSATGPVPTQGNGGASPNATTAQVNAAFAPSITGSPSDVLGSVPGSNGSNFTPGASTTVTGQTADDLWASSAAGQMAVNGLGGPAPARASTAQAPDTSTEPVANDPVSARKRLDENQLTERRAAWKAARTKIHAARLAVQNARTQAERDAALKALGAARAEAHAKMHSLARQHVDEAKNLGQFTTGGTSAPNVTTGTSAALSRPTDAPAVA